MNIKQNLVSPSKYSIKCPYTINYEYVTVHNTDNDAPAKNEISYMIRNDNQVSFHVAIDDIEAIQGIPFTRNAWHCGDGRKDGNMKSIGVEICLNKLGKDNARFKKAEANAVEVCAKLLKDKGFPIDRLRSHKSWSCKNCPSTTNFEDFKSRVKKELDKLNNVNAEVKELDKIVLYCGDIDMFASALVSQKLKCPLMKKDDYANLKVKAKEVIQIGGNAQDVDRFATMKNACKYL